MGKKEKEDKDRVKRFFDEDLRFITIKGKDDKKKDKKKKK
jgi:hypothetical protein